MSFFLCRTSLLPAFSKQSFSSICLLSQAGFRDWQDRWLCAFTKTYSNYQNTYKHLVYWNNSLLPWSGLALTSPFEGFLLEAYFLWDTQKCCSIFSSYFFRLISICAFSRIKDSLLYYSIQAAQDFY